MYIQGDVVFITEHVNLTSLNEAFNFNLQEHIFY